MIRALLPLSLALGIHLPHAAHAEPGAPAAGGAPASCEARVSAVLSFDSNRLPQLSPRTPLTLEWIERIVFLSSADANSSLQDCERLLREVRAHLSTYIHRRLESHLTAGRLEILQHEMTLLKTLHNSSTTRAALEGALPADLSTRYLEQLRDRLFARLSLSPWSQYRDLGFSLEEWTPEWRVALGTDSVAATSLRDARVALAPFALPPGELEYFLFHELAHLAHWRAFPREHASLRRSERFAWSATLDFIAWRTEQHDAIPAEIRRLQNLITGLGLDGWTSIVLRARGLLD